MCGFTAVHHWSQPVDPDEVRRMTEVIVHRGPDDEGYMVQGRTGFGFRRLSIVDQAGGHQPMVSADGKLWIVFNGEIYNHESLRVWLHERGYPCATHSDTEVVLRLYEAVGEAAPRYLRGMFAFVILDRERNRLWGARDPFGIKPLCYARTSSGMIFASEVKSLLMHSEVSKDLDPHSVYQYFTFQYVPETATMFSQIRKIPAGHSFSVSDGKFCCEAYSSIRFEPQENLSLQEHVEAVRAALVDSVAMHRSAEVPYGALLSGGIDSSSIVTMLREHGPLRTFSVGFPTKAANELDQARELADRLGTEHHELLVTPEAFREEIPRMLWYLDEPVADPSAVPLYFVARLARRYVKVALSGEGADELFGGYGIYREPRMLRPLAALPSKLRSLVHHYASRLPEGMYGRGYMLRGTTPLEDRFIGNAKIFSEGMKRKLLQASFPPPPHYHGARDITAPLYAEVEGLDDITRMQHIDIHTWLPGDILHKADRMSMAHSLEVRVPFLDSAVLAAAAAIPVRYRIRGLTTKWILREAMRPYLPKEVAQRPKLGFPVPLQQWMRKELNPFIKEVFLNSVDNPVVNINYALQLLQEHTEGKFDHSRRLWTILVFLLWHSMYCETAQFEVSSLATAGAESISSLQTPSMAGA